MVNVTNIVLLQGRVALRMCWISSTSKKWRVVHADSQLPEAIHPEAGGIRQVFDTSGWWVGGLSSDFGFSIFVSPEVQV
jgi:hypothetical protein